MALEKAEITNTVTGERIPVMFNPEEYTVNKDVNFAHTTIPGLSAPIVQFVAGNAQTVEMELFLDTYEEHASGSRQLNQAGQDVRELTSKITSLLDIEPSTHAPPVVLFVWASLSFTCVLSSATQRFLMFLSDGTPVRATVQVTFSEFKTVDLETKEVKRETSDYTKTYEVGENERLDTIAWREYGNPSKWRAIAIRNRINDPSEVPTGTRLVLPRLPYRDPNTGATHD